VPPASVPELGSKAEIAVSKSQFVNAPPDPWPRRATVALACVTVAICFLLTRLARETTPRETANGALVAKVSSDSIPAASPDPLPAAVPDPPEVAKAISSPQAPAPPVVTAPLPSAKIAASTPSGPAPASVGPAVARPQPAAEAKKPAATVDCRDPYTRDDLGRKIYKRECL
jgi:hypothetical protein